eukprot:197838-Alexandrium_andersonii.AAC.1
MVMYVDARGSEACAGQAALAHPAGQAPPLERCDGPLPDLGPHGPGATLEPQVALADADRGDLPAAQAVALPDEA